MWHSSFNKVTSAEPLAAAKNVLMALACVGFLSGCSDDDSDNYSYTSSSSVAVEEDIVETAVSLGNFTMLVEALQAAELDDDLADPTASLTVFAPTDDAFEALKATMTDEEWAALLASDDLAKILLYHVVQGEVAAADAIAASGDLVPTLNGNWAALDYQEGVVMVNDASVVTADVAASNGVIHAIDKVIMPPAGTITDLVVANDSFSTLETAVVTAGLQGTLAGDGPFTVFAPTDDAFAKLGQETIDAVLANSDLLTNILTYHVIDTLVPAADALGLQGQDADMLNDEEADIRAVDGSLYIDRAKISVTNVVATNGVIHIIDSVMKPEGVDVPDGDIVDILAADTNFSTLVTAVTEAELVTTLQGDGPFTVFAPTNDAFAALPDGTLESLLANIPDLSNILRYHVYGGSVDAAAAVAAAGSSITMNNGSDAEVVLDSGVLMVDDAAVILTDIIASNGIIHVIDAVMLSE